MERYAAFLYSLIVAEKGFINVWHLELTGQFKMPVKKSRICTLGYVLCGRKQRGNMVGA